MITSDTQEYMLRLKALIANQYSANPKDLQDPSIHRGLRNADGTGVLIGVTNIGSVQGYYMEEGERRPMPGKLYYRGISLESIVESHRKNGTFGFTEVVFLLLTGKLPTQKQLDRLYADTIFSQNPWRASLEKSLILYQKLLAALAEYNQFLD